jgi:hypothetical protein
MEKLTDKVKQIYDTYANENTYFDRIALVGCDTSRIRQGLTRNFAKMGLGGFDGNFAVAVLNDNITLIVAEIFF